MRTPLALFENLLYDLTLFVSMFTSHDLHYDVSKSTVGDRQGTRVQAVPVAKNGVKNTPYNEKAWLRIIDIGLTLSYLMELLFPNCHFYYYLVLEY